MNREQALATAFRRVLETTYQFSKSMVKFDTLVACRASGRLYEATRRGTS